MLKCVFVYMVQITKDLFRVLHVDGSRLLATVLRHEEIDLHCSDCDSSDPFVSEARLALASRKASIQQHGVSVVSAAPSVDTRAADTPVRRFINFPINVLEIHILPPALLCRLQMTPLCFTNSQMERMLSLFRS
jgi:hypothetical protein